VSRTEQDFRNLERKEKKRYRKFTQEVFVQVLCRAVGRGGGRIASSNILGGRRARAENLCATWFEDILK